MRYFNVTGICYPEKHYMVDISKRLEKIETMIERGDYFCINRGRQYGKTTTLFLLREKIKNDYLVFSLSFEEFGDTEYQSLEFFLAGFIKMKIRSKERHQYNSPWNIAADFNIDLSFFSNDIFNMLAAYEKDHKTGMDISAISELLYEYTSGYPFLVCRLCKILDEILPEKAVNFRNPNLVRTKEGVLEAVKLLLQESNTLFDDIGKKLTDFTELKKMLYEILYHGVTIAYNQYEKSMNIGMMFDFIKNENWKMVVANRIFEMWLYNLFAAEEFMDTEIYAEGS